MNDLFSLSGKFFLVTGGTRGLGRAISLRFAQSGARVMANYVRNDQAAESLKDLARQENLALEVCRADITTKKGLEALFDQLGSEANVSGLVHCAATGVHRSFQELTTRHLDWTWSLNVRAFFELVQLLLPRFRSGSTIIAVSSEGAARAVPAYAVVGAAKGALEALARHLAVELAPQGIRVNILLPGSVLTEAWEAFPEKETRLKEAIDRSPLKRLITPEEVAWAAQFLSSQASSGLIGHTLVVDGGKGIVS